jgi:hypothetical protein
LSQEAPNDQTNPTPTPDPAPDPSTSNTEPKIDLAGDDPQPDPDPAEDNRTDEEKAAEAARAELFGAPDGDAGYEIEGLPEGMEIDKAALDAVTPTFKELGLSNKGAAKVAQVYAEKVLPSVMERATQSIEQQVVAQRAEWEGQAEAAIKSNGAELKNQAGETLSFDAKDKSMVLKTAAKALDHLAPQGFRDFLKDTGLSQHPAMVAFAYQAGKLLAEDNDLETTDTGANKPKSRVEKYYG